MKNRTIENISIVNRCR